VSIPGTSNIHLAPGRSRGGSPFLVPFTIVEYLFALPQTKVDLLHRPETKTTPLTVLTEAPSRFNNYNDVV
jgi:hypothetical protein